MLVIYSYIINVTTMYCPVCCIQAIRDAKERERLLEEKEIQLFADAKKVQTCISHVPNVMQNYF